MSRCRVVHQGRRRSRLLHLFGRLCLPSFLRRLGLLRLFRLFGWWNRLVLIGLLVVQRLFRLLGRLIRLTLIRLWIRLTLIGLLTILRLLVVPCAGTGAGAAADGSGHMFSSLAVGDVHGDVWTFIWQPMCRNERWCIFMPATMTAGGLDLRSSTGARSRRMQKVLPADRPS